MSVVHLKIPRPQLFFTNSESDGFISLASMNVQRVFFTVCAYPRIIYAWPIIFAASSLVSPSSALYSFSLSYFVNPFPYIHASACWNSVPVYAVVEDAIALPDAVPVLLAVHVVMSPVSVFPVYMVPVSALHVPVAPVFVTTVIFLVMGSMIIWKFPVVSALMGNASRRAVAAKTIPSVFLFIFFVIIDKNFTKY